MKSTTLLRTSTVAAAVTLVAGLLSGCGGGATGGGEGSVTIGFLGNLTGDQATTFGKPFKNGFELALTEIEDADGLEDVDINLETTDAASEVAQAVTGFNKFQQQRVPIVVSDSSSAIGQAVGPLANDGETVFLTGSGSEVENKDGYAFRFTDLGTPTASLGTYVTELGATRIGAVVATDLPSYPALAEATAAGLPDGYVVEEEVTSADSDFAAILANLEKADVDAVLLSMGPDQVGNVVRQMAQNGGFDDVELLGTLATAPETYTIAGDDAVGIVFPQVWAPGTGDTSEFEDAYEAEYSETPSAYGGMGYQIAWILAAAIQQVQDDGDDVTAEAVRDALPDASTSEIVQEHGILDLQLNADGSAKSQGALATFDESGAIVSATAAGS